MITASAPGACCATARAISAALRTRSICTPAGGSIFVGPLTLTLVRTPDILAELGRNRGGDATPILVGFAAETGDPRPRARQKLASKQVDLIVANDVSRADAGFDTDTNAATFISADGEVDQPLQSKGELAKRILDRVEQLLTTIARRSPTSDVR